MKLSKSPVKAFGMFKAGRDNSPANDSAGNFDNEPLRSKEKNA